MTTKRTHGPCTIGRAWGEHTPDCPAQQEPDALSKPCPGCDAPSDPATWKPLTYEGRTRNACPACHSDQAQLDTEVLIP